MNNKEKKISLADKGQAASDIDIDEFFFYFEKRNRKRLEKAFSDVYFEEILLSVNDRTGKAHVIENPFEQTKRDLKLQQSKLKTKIYSIMDKLFESEHEKFGVTKSIALEKTKAMIREESGKV